MINFCQKPDRVLCVIIDYSLEELKRHIGKTAFNVIHPELHRLFSKKLLKREIEKLLQANIDDIRFYDVTSYHYLILERALDYYACVIHNEVVNREGAISFGSKYVIGYINTDLIIDNMFWDLDHLKFIPSGKTDDLEMSYLTPHPDELKVVETHGNRMGVNYYKKGRDYPYVHVSRKEIDEDLK